MPIADEDENRVVRLLIHDLHATIGLGHDEVASHNAAQLREFADDGADYVQRVVESTQQNLHDEFVDTAWPRCPRHPHPLWFRDGAWWCEADHMPVARLGDLGSNAGEPRLE